MTMTQDEEIREIAEYLHDQYEAFSRLEGLKTRDCCRVEFNDLPEQNKKVMLRVAKCIYTINEVNKKKVAREIFEKLDKKCNFEWALEQMEKYLAEHNNPASNIMNVACHVQYEFRKVKKEYGVE